jgi:PHD/YefM family antitoxin component YafN of YafNO toxin-antitoxin module
MKHMELTPDLNLDTVLQQMNGEDIVLTRKGHAVALLSDFDDDELYWYERERDPAFIESIAQARKQVAEGKTITHEELKKRLGIE